MNREGTGETRVRACMSMSMQRMRMSIETQGAILIEITTSIFRLIGRALKRARKDANALDSP